MRLLHFVILVQAFQVFQRETTELRLHLADSTYKQAVGIKKIVVGI
jgi:hypothetical protein